MGDEARRYRFPPLERRGLVAGLGGAQLGVVAAGCIAAVLVLRGLPTVVGVVLAGAVLAGSGAGACWTVAGRSPSGWAPVVGSWAWRRLVRAAPTDAPRVGTTGAGPPRPALPRALAGVSISAAPPFPGSPPMGVVRDIKAGTLVGISAVHGRSFSLLDPSEKERRLAAWGAALAALCRDGSAVHRIQWVERAVPGNSEGLRRYFDEAAVGSGRCRESYGDLIAGAGAVGQVHQTLVVVAIHPRRSGRAVRPFGRGHAGACGLLRRELRLLQGQLGAAELVAGRVLTDAEVAASLRCAIDPGYRRPACRAESAWPMATDDGWSACRIDGQWHATYWISEWPRIDVGADFLSPLLLGATSDRVVAVVMAPVGPAQAAREVEAARTADLADERLRERAGFLSTARRQREAEGVIRRESELADGHADYRFSGYVTVSAADPPALGMACAETEQTARQSGLELRRLYGQQLDAFTWTMPLARGLR